MQRLAILVLLALVLLPATPAGAAPATTGKPLIPARYV